jgi:predicted DNA-binding transcriptional regulator AlpA
MTTPAHLIGDIHFWRLPDVLARVGLSKTELYRRMRDTDPELNPFPASRPYRGEDKKGVFWLSTDIRDWQLREIGVATTQSRVLDPASLLG